MDDRLLYKCARSMNLHPDDIEKGKQLARGVLQVAHWEEMRDALLWQLAWLRGRAMLEPGRDYSEVAGRIESVPSRNGIAN